MLSRADKDKVFVECDEHMFLLGKQELPKGISFHSGLDWICLHRDFVEYAVTGTDPLVTGLKEMYKYIISPVEVGVLHHAITAHEHLTFGI